VTTETEPDTSVETCSFTSSMFSDTHSVGLIEMRVVHNPTAYVGNVSQGDGHESECARVLGRHPRAAAFSIASARFRPPPVLLVGGFSHGSSNTTPGRFE
jgi:hypothetical protein